MSRGFRLCWYHKLMNRFFLLPGVLCVPTLLAQETLWRHIQDEREREPPPIWQTLVSPATLSQSQQDAIVKLVWLNRTTDSWPSGSEDKEWLTNLTFDTIPLSPRTKVILVAAPMGAPNSEMWLFRLSGTSRPTLLAGPQQTFGGFLFSLEPTFSHGYRDIVLGWHMSAAQTDLKYFRFDGRVYRAISSATLDANGVSSIAPVRH